MLNGRGYPDTVNPAELLNTADDEGFMPRYSQKVPALVEAVQGDRILLRISNLSVTNFYTVTVLGIPMKVVGQGARLLRGPDGKDLYYDTTAVTLGGGEAKDVILDTSGIDQGTYFLYTTNLNYLSNDTEDFGGMMTEIVVAAAARANQNGESVPDGKPAGLEEPSETSKPRRRAFSGNRG